MTDDRSNRRHLATVLVDMWSLDGGQYDKGLTTFRSEGVVLPRTQRVWPDVERNIQLINIHMI